MTIRQQTNSTVFPADAAIIELYWQRDEAAIRLTADKYGTRLRALADSFLSDAMAAEECENDTYLRTWNAIPPHRPVQYFFAFLAKITRQLALDACKARQRHKRGGAFTDLTEELQQCIPSPDDTESAVEAAEWGRVLSAFLQALPPQQRGVFLRRYWYGDSVQAIAVRYGFTQSKVKSMLLRTRTALRSHLQKEGMV